MSASFRFNGEVRALDAATSVADLVATLGLDPRGVAIERNRAIVPRSQWAATMLADGDVVELVQFVGGGL